MNLSSKPWSPGLLSLTLVIPTACGLFDDASDLRGRPENPEPAAGDGGATGGGDTTGSGATGGDDTTGSGATGGGDAGDTDPPPPDPPLGNFDHFSWTQGSTYAIPAPGVLANDETSAGAYAVASGSATTARGGVVVLAADGGLEFTPPAGQTAFWGDDYFDYELVGPGAPVTTRARLTIQPEVLVLDDIANGGSGVSVQLPQANNELAVAAGDFNGDGFADIVIGNGGRNIGGQNSAGEVSIIYGNAGLQTLRSGDDDRISGNLADAQLGRFLAAVGDFNGDGLEDLLVGAPGDQAQALNQRAGAAYLVFGWGTNPPPTMEDLRANQGGFPIHGLENNGGDALVLAAAGDFNGDGLSDIVVGIEDLLGDFESRAYVVYGRTGSETLVLGEGGNNQGFRIDGGLDDTEFGLDTPHLSVAGLGDVDGDGLDDVGIVTAARAFVLFGQTASATDLELEQGVPADRGIQLGADTTEALDRATIAAAGDFNDDGYADVALGLVRQPPNGDEDPAANDFRGLYIVSGSPSLASLSLSNFSPSAGLHLAFPADLLGCQSPEFIVASAGDTNADRVDDLLVALLQGGGQSCGGSPPRNAQVLLGGANPSSSALGQPAADRRPILPGLSQSDEDYELGLGRDINGDGLNDALMATGGTVHAIYGFHSQVQSNPAALSHVVLNAATSDLVYSGDPAVAIVGDLSAAGNTLRLEGPGTSLDLTGSTRVESIEVIDLRAAEAQSLILNDAAVRRLPQSQANAPLGWAKILVVLGNDDDSVQFVDGTPYTLRTSNADRRVFSPAGAVLYGLEISAAMTAPDLNQ